MPHDNDDDRGIPDAGEIPNVDLSQLVIGPPFAMFGDCEHLQTDKAKGVGSFSCIRCDCGHAFKIDLLKERPTACPSCKAIYTHVLAVCRMDDTEMFDDLGRQVMEANGLELPDDDEEQNPDDDAGDGDADEGSDNEA